MCLQDRARCAHGHLEALPRSAPLVAVEEDRDLVARRVLELLHHELAAPRRRAPVHLAQRLAPLVLAHAVQLEACRPAEEEPAAVLCVRTSLGEEPFQRDQARVDDKRLRLPLDELAARQRERILDREPHGLECVAPARDALELVAGAEAPAAERPELDPTLSETAGALVCDERRRWNGRGGDDLELDPDVVALDDVADGAVAADVRRT